MNRLSRQSFLTLAAAAPLLHGCAGGLSRLTPPISGDYDVAIIGAGSAGIGAATVLSAHPNVKFPVLEAQDHIGGRCHCDNTSFPGIAFDLGGQWFHQVTPALGKPNATNNPLYDLALTKGLMPTQDTNQRLLCRAGAPFEDLLNTPVIDTIDAAGAAIATAGAAALSGLAPDQSVDAAISSLSGLPYFDLVWGLLASFMGGNLADISSEDLFFETFLAEASPVTPSTDNYLLESGIGNFLASLATGLPIHLNTTVTKVDWSGRSALLTTSAGTITARTVIVAVPLGAITNGVLNFSPPLPADYQAAIAGLPLRQVEKIALLFDSDVFGTPKPNTFANQYVNARTPSLTQTRAWGHNYAILIVGGPGIEQIERNNGLVDYALQELAIMFPNATRSHLVQAVATNWITSPLFGGAYSFAKPGAAEKRSVLQQPIANRVFFGGEAVSIESHSSIHGAWITGQQAATGALVALT